ncbi:MAG: hypothetical protein C4307_04900 [Chloroflexota bacterium]
MTRRDARSLPSGAVTARVGSAAAVKLSWKTWGVPASLDVVSVASPVMLQLSRGTGIVSGIMTLLPV